MRNQCIYKTITRIAEEVLIIFLLFFTGDIENDIENIEITMIFFNISIFNPILPPMNITTSTIPKL